MDQEYAKIIISLRKQVTELEATIRSLTNRVQRLESDQSNVRDILGTRVPFPGKSIGETQKSITDAMTTTNYPLRG